VIAAAIRRWAAWSPGRESEEAWRQWCAAPVALEEHGSPEARFLPPMLRRRCSPLARTMLTVAFECCDESERARVATVFASRHGNINESIDLLERVARREPLSPTRFSHTVHNAQAGLYSIAAGNRQGSSSISAFEESFACGFLEAATFLQREPARPVLLVMADAPLSDTFAPLVQEPRCAYALALLLASDGPGRVGFRLDPSEPAPPRRDWPDAAEFLRWWVGDEDRLILGTGPRRWVWERN
jgi:hypothetical protein